MADNPPPHFAYPFHFGPTGAVDVVEQDSPAEIATCVANIVVCPVGYRIDLPAFGVDSVLFQPQPLDTTALVSQAETWEPRAQITSAYADMLEIMLTTGVAQGKQALLGESDVNLIVAPNSQETTSD